MDATTKQLIQASDDIVWDFKERNAYKAARELVYKAMLYSLLPCKVHSTRSWANAQAAVHEERAKAFQLKLELIKSEDGWLGVWQLVDHHKRIAARYTAVADAMQD